MSYSILATSRTPALIIYVIDISASMSLPLDETSLDKNQKSKIDIVYDALQLVFNKMVFRSTKGVIVSPRYRVAILGYSDQVIMGSDGVVSIADQVKKGIPKFNILRTTDTALAFKTVENILIAERPNMADCPAPLVCHLTDGIYTGDDPQPIIRRIMNMDFADGKVLVENIYISNEVLKSQIEDPKRWAGITKKTKLASDYAEKLREMSSLIPESYRMMMLENNYKLSPDAVMMFPGMTPEFVSMGFQMSTCTPIV